MPGQVQPAASGVVFGRIFVRQGPRELCHACRHAILCERSVIFGVVHVMLRLASASYYRVLRCMMVLVHCIYFHTDCKMERTRYAECTYGDWPCYPSPWWGGECTQFMLTNAYHTIQESSMCFLDCQCCTSASYYIVCDPALATHDRQNWMHAFYLMLGFAIAQTVGVTFGSVATNSYPSRSDCFMSNSLS